MNDTLDAILQEAVPYVAPSAALTVIHRGETRINRAWGEATPDSLFDLASLTKLYTVTALLSAGDTITGAESLDMPLVEIVPEFGAESPRSIDGGQDPHSKQRLDTPPDLRGVTVNPADVTLRHLLTHTSGLPAWRDVYTTSPPPPPPTERDPIGRAARWRRGLAAMCAYPFVRPVGAEVIYSDIGMMLLGEAVARLHGADLEAAIQQKVIAPLNLTDTLFNPVRDGGIMPERTIPTEDDPAWRGRRVWGEVHDENACGLGGVAGHAGLFGTAADVATFGQAWLTRSAFDIGADLWTAAITEQSRTGAHVHGLGWMLPSDHDSSAGDRMSRSAFGHTGFTGTSLWVDPVHEVVVALLTNRVYHGRQRTGIHALRRAVHDAVIDAC